MSKTLGAELLDLGRLFEAVVAPLEEYRRQSEAKLETLQAAVFEDRDRV